jgi:hypothetical protein
MSESQDLAGMGVFSSMKIAGKIVGNPSLDWSPLERLANEFHQDFGILGVDVQTTVARHISLNSEQRQVLKKELTVFLSNYPGKSDKGITRAWAKLGAQSWTGGLTTRELLNNILEMI